MYFFMFLFKKNLYLSPDLSMIHEREETVEETENDRKFCTLWEVGTPLQKQNLASKASEHTWTRWLHPISSWVGSGPP